jgi:hypothetical protein
MELDTGSTPENPIFKAVTCNSNNYGTADTMYGLEELPCGDCLEGMVTANLYKNAETMGCSACWFVIQGPQHVIGMRLLPAGHSHLASQLPIR